MNDIATRAGAREAPPRALWSAIPLECFVCAAAILLAAVLKLAGVMP